MTRRLLPAPLVPLTLALMLVAGGCTSADEAPPGPLDDATPAPLADTASTASAAPGTDSGTAPSAPATAPIAADGAPVDPALAEAAAAAIPDELARFECAGSDPPWTLALSRAGATLELEGTSRQLDGELKATPTGAWTWLGTVGTAPDDSYALLLSPSTCFPGEGVPAQPYVAELSLPDGRRTSGCCAPAAADRELR